MHFKKGQWLAVVDGARAMIFVNDGTAFAPNLKVVRTYGQDNPKTSDQGRDRPGRTFESTGTRRSTNEAPDLHQRAEETFITGIVRDLEKDAGAGAFDEIIIAAPPIALGTVRKAAAKPLAERVRLWIDKDLTKETTPDITKSVVKALEG